MDLVKRFEVYFVNLDPTVGSEIQKVRPCVVISPDELNSHLNTVIIAPLTSTLRHYPTRVNCRVDGKDGQIALDQIRAVDKLRLLRKAATLDERTSILVLDVLQEIFC
jgi:mRNA interferase MazF